MVNKYENEADGNPVIPPPGGSNETDKPVIPQPGVSNETGKSVIPQPGGSNVETGKSVIPPPTKQELSTTNATTTMKKQSQFVEPQTFNQTNAATELSNNTWYFVIGP